MSCHVRSFLSFGNIGKLPIAMSALTETPRSKLSKTTPKSASHSAFCRYARKQDIRTTLPQPGPLSTPGAGDSTRCLFASALPSVCGRLLTSVKAGLLTAEGGLYAPRLGPPPGMPILRVGSMEGFVKFARLGPGPGAPPLLPCCGGTVAAFANAVPRDSRMMGADFPGFTPCVLRMEGLSACGLKAAGAFAAALPSDTWFKRLALRPVTKPASTPAGGSVGIGGW